MARGRIEIDEAMCKGCALCTVVCPKEVIAMAEDRFTPKGYHPAELADPEDECTGCAICALICPEAAIRVFRDVPVQKARAALAS
jgi:2-oxoglutarate ferredoxin oxidoreductase subunit delta